MFLFSGFPNCKCGRVVPWSKITLLFLRPYQRSTFSTPSVTRRVRRGGTCWLSNGNFHNGQDWFTTEFFSRSYRKRPTIVFVFLPLRLFYVVRAAPTITVPSVNFSCLLLNNQVCLFCFKDSWFTGAPGVLLVAFIHGTAGIPLGPYAIPKGLARPHPKDLLPRRKLWICPVICRNIILEPNLQNWLFSEALGYLGCSGIWPPPRQTHNLFSRRAPDGIPS